MNVFDVAKQSMDITNSIHEIQNTNFDARIDVSNTVPDGREYSPDSRVDIKGKVAEKKEYDPDERIHDKENVEGNENDESNVPSIESLQQQCIKEAESNSDLNALDSQAKGNYAEMKVDRDLDGKGYDRISKECVTDLIHNTGPGIDGVFVNKENGQVLITETKFNKSELGNTIDGRQMSSSWIDNRLDASVGKEMADKIRLDSILNPDSVQSVLARVDLNGDISYFRLDTDANILGGINL